MAMSLLIYLRDGPESGPDLYKGGPPVLNEINLLCKIVSNSEVDRWTGVR